MSVYVAPMNADLQRFFGTPNGCMIFGDDNGEAKAFVAKLKIKNRDAYRVPRSPARLDYFALTIEERDRALAAGARQLSREQAATYFDERESEQKAKAKDSGK